METIYILAKVDASRAEAIVGTLSKVQGVIFAHAVTGPYDLLIGMEGENLAKLLSRSIKEVGGLEGIKSTETLVAIRLSE
jgi:DNA-binding Lrp family transcriptional regulator